MILSALHIKAGQRFLACFGANAPWLSYICVINHDSFSSKFFFLATKTIIWVILVIALILPSLWARLFQRERRSGAAVSFSLWSCSPLVRRRSGYRYECEWYFHWHHTPLSDILGRVQLAAPHISLTPRGFNNAVIESSKEPDTKSAHNTKARIRNHLYIP